VLVAIDRSSSIGSAALFSLEGALLASVSDSEAGYGDAYGLFDRVLRDADVSSCAVTRFAAGIGPGSFSGIRSAIAVLSGLALPSGASVEGVSSAAATNAVFRRRHPEADTVAVVGDARRGHIWVALFEPDTHAHNGIEDFVLIDHDAVASRIPSHAAVITPDMSRIGPLLISAFSEARVFAAIPTAEAVGRLALGGCSATALPIYLHPAVVPQERRCSGAGVRR